MAVSRLFTEAGKAVDKMNESVRQAIATAKEAGVQVTKSGQSFISKFDEALNPTKRLAEQIQLLNAAGKNSADIWKVMGDEISRASDAAKKNGQAIDPLVKSMQEMNKVTLSSKLSFENVGRSIQDFAQNPVGAAQAGLGSLLSTLGPTAIGVGAVGAAAVTAAVGIYKIAASAADAAERIQNMSYALGLSTTEIQAFSRLAEESGLEDLTSKIVRLNAQLGSNEGGDFVEALLRMNIAIKDSKKITDYLSEIHNRYMALGDPIKIAVQGSADFGKMWPEIAPLVANAGLDIKKTLDDITKSGAVMSQQQFDYSLQLDQRLDEHGRKWKALGNVISEAATFATNYFLGGFESWLKGGDFGTGAMLGNLPVLPTPGDGNPPAAGHGSDQDQTGFNEIERRIRIIAEADAVAAGTKRGLIELTIRLNDLERQYSEEKSKQKGAKFDEEKVQSLATQIQKTKELLKAREETIKKQEDLNKKLKEFEANQQILSGIAIKNMHDSWAADAEAIRRKQVEGFTKFVEEQEKKRLENSKIIGEFNLSLDKAIEDSKLEQLKIEQQINDAVVPRNEQERIQMQLEKIHDQSRIEAEEVRLKYTRLRAELELKIKSLNQSAPNFELVRDQMKEDLAQLDTALSKALGGVAQKESAQILQVHRGEYQRMVDQVKQGAGEIFDVIVNAGRNGLGSLMDWLKNTFLNSLKKIFQDFFANILTGQGGLAQSLSGLFGGLSSPSGGGWQNNIPFAGMFRQQGGMPTAVQVLPSPEIKALTDIMGEGAIFQAPEKTNWWKSMFGEGGQGMNWSEFFGGGKGGFFGSDGQGGFLGSGTGGINGKGVGGAAGGMMMTAGGMMYLDAAMDWRDQSAGAWAKSIGGGALAGFALGGPLGAAIGAAVGAITKSVEGLVKWAQGKTNAEAGISEISRDYGGIKMSKDVYNQVVESMGLDKDSGDLWRARGSVAASPAMLQQMFELAKQQGKMGDFMDRMNNWLTYTGPHGDASQALKIGEITGDWTKLNELWKQSQYYQDLVNRGLKEQADMMIVGDAAASELLDTFKSFRESIKSSIVDPLQTSIDKFMETGDITDNLRDKILQFGGDLSKFEDLSGLIKLNSTFQEMSNHFAQTGELLPELMSLAGQYGADLAKLSEASDKLTTLNKTASMVGTLQGSLQSLAQQFDPIQQFLSGQWNSRIEAALSGAGLDPAKFSGLSAAINASGNWDNISNQALKGGIINKDLQEALAQFGGAQGQLALQQYKQGFNTITQDLLDTVKASMDKSYEQNIQEALDYLGNVGSETNEQITQLTDTVEAQLQIAGDNISEAVNTAKKDILDTLDKILIAIYDQENPEAAVDAEAAAVPRLADGGLILKTGLAIVDKGERFDGGRGFGSYVFVSINGNVYGLDDLDNKLKESFQRLDRRGELFFRHA
jgi:hypothetical protein